MRQNTQTADTIKKIQGYITRTGIERKPSELYQINLQEILVLSHLACDGDVEAICLAFEYGRAKGYRAGRAGSWAR